MSKKEGDRTKHSSADKKADIANTISKKILLENIIKKIEYYSVKTTVTDLDLYYLVKEFFRDYMDIKYEFSLDELIMELDKIYLETKQREEVIKFIEKIKLIEYHDEPFKEAKIKAFILEFLPLAKSLSKAGTVQSETIWSKLKTIFVKPQAIAYEDYETAKPKKTELIPEKTLPDSAVKEIPEDESEKQREIETQENTIKTAVLSEPSAPTDLASIEEHNRRILGDNSDSKNIPDTSAALSPDSVKKSDSHSNKKMSKKEKKEEKERKKAEKKNIASEPNSEKEKTDSKPVLKDSPITNNPSNKTAPQSNTGSVSWTEENLSKSSSKEKQREGKKAKTEQKTKKNNIPKSKETKANNKSITAKKQNKTTKQSKIKKTTKITNSAKKIKTAKTVAKISKAKSAPTAKKVSVKNTEVKINKSKSDNKTSKKNTIETTKTSKPEASIVKDDINSLINTAKKTTNKHELMELYKRINALYEKGDVTYQGKYYKDVMIIYKKLSKMK